ncbi:MAG: adenylylsulfate kinase [Lachnospiraceae bacterium]|nr:adenylylsulfate kinase [Lachnospiraceae bacterium]
MKIENLLLENWEAPTILKEIPHGDMPGDKVEINETHVLKANLIFPKLLQELQYVMTKSGQEKAVIAVCGGSGVGKSETASLLAYYLNEAGIGAYTMSGDNYPHRIPKYNDAERLHVFRESALKGMIAAGTYTKERVECIHNLQVKEDDANPKYSKEYDWFSTYLEAGRRGLSRYLGTSCETGFDEVENIVSQFKNGADHIFLKRMGREDTDLWYEDVNFSDIQVLIIEWTHGNSDCFEGVDIPILLNSTPEETLEHRRSRARDGAVDSSFTTMVLELEQQLLMSQAHKAKIIVTKSGDLIDYNQYCELMR